MIATVVRYLLVVGGTLWVYTIAGQADTMLVYDAPIVSIKEEGYIAEVYRQLDTVTSVAAALDLLSDVQVQQLSPGGLATALTGGSAARHLQVLWSGWNIQSPINGTYDLSLLPAGLFDEARYLDRTVTSATGNAGHRGALILDARHNKTGQVLVGYDNWHNTSLFASKGYCVLGGELDLRASYNQHENQYTYDRLGEVQRQDNAALEASNLSASYRLPLGRSIIATADIWHQYSSRTLAPSKTSSYNGEEQRDRNTRYAVSLEGQTEQIRWGAKAAYFDEHIDYSSATVDSRGNNYAAMGELSASTLSPHKTSLSTTWRRDAARSTFAINDERETLSIGLDQRWQVSSTVDVSAALRWDHIDGQSQPAALTLRSAYRPSSDWQIAADYSRSYTYPTFNDLYWPQQGNPDLDIEQGQTATLSATKTSHIGRLLISTGVTVQAQHVSQWILWAPRSNGIWSPLNQRAVRHLSIRPETSATYSIDQHRHLRLTTSLYLASNRIQQDDNDDSLEGKQLIYLPSSKWVSTASYQAPRWSLSTTVSHIGRRYTDSRNTSTLAPYLLANIRASYQAHDRIQVQISVDNLTATVYEIVPFFPTGLRRLGTTLRIDF